MKPLLKREGCFSAILAGRESLMDMGAIAGVQAAIKATLELVRAGTNAAVDQKVKQQMIDMQSAVLDIQAKLGDAHGERLALLEEVADLKSRLRDIEATKQFLDMYELHEVDTGKYLYKYKKTGGGMVDHFACPVCHNAGRVSVLQSAKTGEKRTHYVCRAHSCSFQLAVGPADPPQPHRVVSSGYVRNW
jgi:hypothetical protein